MLCVGPKPRQRCYKIICDELSFDKFTDESRSLSAALRGISVLGDHDIREKAKVELKQGFVVQKHARLGAAPKKVPGFDSTDMH